jgi:predicted transcriptional regulator
MPESRKIYVREIRLPGKADEKKDIEWIIESLSLSSAKDNDKTASKIFKELIDAAREQRPVSTTQISEKVGVTRGTVLFHLQKFSQCGLVRSSGRTYTLRHSSLEETVDSMLRDAEQMFKRMRRVASELDAEMGFEKRW